MVPAEDLKVHIGSNQRVDIAYYHLMLNHDFDLYSSYRRLLIKINLQLSFTSNALEAFSDTLVLPPRFWQRELVSLTAETVTLLSTVGEDFLLLSAAMTFIADAVTS